MRKRWYAKRGRMLETTRRNSGSRKNMSTDSERRIDATMPSDTFGRKKRKRTYEHALLPPILTHIRRFNDGATYHVVFHLHNGIQPHVCGQ